MRSVRYQWRRKSNPSKIEILAPSADGGGGVTVLYIPGFHYNLVRSKTTVEYQSQWVDMITIKVD